MAMVITQGMWQKGLRDMYQGSREEFALGAAVLAALGPWKPECVVVRWEHWCSGQHHWTKERGETEMSS